MGCNIKVYLKEVDLKDADLINPAQDREKEQAVVNTVMNFRVP